MSKSSKKNVPKKNSSVRPYTVMCTDLYLLWILLVYPLYYADGYFHLPERKATFWCTSTLIYIGVTLLGVIITYVSTRDEWSLERIKKNISMTDIFMFGFLISNLIAFALSEDKTNAWTGAGARYYGAKVLILVCISYFLISRYAWLNKVFIWAFLIAGNGVCLLITLDYFWYDVLGINQQMQQSDQIIFYSTIGNINTCASIVAMIVSCAVTYYCVSTNIKDKIIAAVSIINCSVAISTVRSDTAGLGVGIILFLLIILACFGKIKIKNILQVVSLLCCTFVAFSFVRAHFPGKYYWKVAYHTVNDTGIPRIIWEKPQLFIAILIVALGLYVIVEIMERKKVKLKKNQKRYTAVGASVAILFSAVYAVKKYNIVEIFKNGMGIDVGNAIGTRVYMYSRALGIYGKESIINKIFGNGQGSISQLYYNYYGDELMSVGISINSSHCHVLDYMLTVGSFGMICYLVIVVYSVIKMVKQKFESPIGTIFTMTFVAYFVQGFFNIDQVVTTVFFWLFIAMNESAWNKGKKL